jgi:hypothetical protein
MKSFRFFVVPVAAMAVAFVWSSMVTAPQGVLTPYPLPAQKIAVDDWQRDAGDTFGLRPAQVGSAMTEREWETHQKKMWVMMPAEREQYQQNVRTTILKQAQG